MAKKVVNPNPTNESDEEVQAPPPKPKAPCSEKHKVHPSNTALGYLPELLSPAPLRCGVGKGTPNSVVNVLHAHKT